MTNDNTPPTAPDTLTPNQRLLHAAISEAVGMLQERQMHTVEMTPVFDWWSKWSREATTASKRR